MQIIRQSTTEQNGSLYKNVLIRTDKGKEISVIERVDEKRGYVNVNLNNTMQRAYRSMGKDFTSFKEAKAHYKNADILSVITAAEFLFNNNEIVFEA